MFNSWFDYQGLITERLIDFVRTPVTHGGGITHLRQLMGVADFYGFRSGFHGPSDISPVGMAANCHLGWTIHNFGVQEYMGYPEQTSEVFTRLPVVENGVVGRRSKKWWISRVSIASWVSCAEGPLDRHA